MTAKITLTEQVEGTLTLYNHVTEESLGTLSNNPNLDIDIVESLDNLLTALDAKFPSANISDVVSITRY